MKITTAEFPAGNETVKVHAISTGQVAVKKKFRDSTRKGNLAMLASFLDQSFTEWMPIWVWVIEHSEGVFVIDTGENSNVNDPGYFRSSGWFENWLNTTQFKFKVDREEEIDRQLKSLGIAPEAVDKVIITHLHLDHIDGIKHFPHSDIVVNKVEWERPYGDLPKLYPTWFKPKLIDLNESYGPFKKVKSITRKGDLMMVHTPGHTYGHCSVLLKTGAGYLFFAGDVSYDQNQLLNEAYAAANVNASDAKHSYQLIKSFARSNAVVYLPSHDAEAGTRLEQMEFLKIDELR